MVFPLPLTPTRAVTVSFFRVRVDVFQDIPLHGSGVGEFKVAHSQPFDGGQHGDPGLPLVFVFRFVDLTQSFQADFGILCPVEKGDHLLDGSVELPQNIADGQQHTQGQVAIQDSNGSSTLIRMFLVSLIKTPPASWYWFSERHFIFTLKRPA